jgi:hypothetical protein
MGGNQERNNNWHIQQYDKGTWIPRVENFSSGHRFEIHHSMSVQ